jgi:hypothetical protein
MHQKSRVAMAVAVLSSALSTLATIAQAQSISIPGLRAFPESPTSTIDGTLFADEASNTLWACSNGTRTESSSSSNPLLGLPWRERFSDEHRRHMEAVTLLKER